MYAVKTVAALFVRADSYYKTMPGVDAWDEARDARNWPGGCPVVAHPPCRGWGRLRRFSHATESEKELAIDAVAYVRRNGGVLEHPEESTLWVSCRLPRPGQSPDIYGGWTLQLEQFHFGHRAEKSTWLYVVGIEPDGLPPLPCRAGRPTHCIRPTRAYPRLPSVTKREREQTPPAFAEWLISLARRCEVREEIAA